MKATKDSPFEPVENLRIGTLIEVDGTHIVAELDPQIKELSRVYGGEVYSIGQFGSIIRVHFGRRLVYGYVSRLMLKTEYEMQRGAVAASISTDRIIEADLFGEGEWQYSLNADDKTWRLLFERGVSSYPLPMQSIYLTPKDELSAIFGKGDSGSVIIGEHVGAAGTPCFADLNELIGKHTAIVGSTGCGKSATVASLIHTICERGSLAGYERWNPRIIILDPHDEYGAAFSNHSRLSTDEGTLTLPYWLLDFNETVDLIIGRTEYAATSQTNIVKNALQVVREAGATAIGLDPNEISIDSPVPYQLGDPEGLDEFGQKDGAAYEVGLVGAINALRPANRNKKDHEDYNKIIRKLQTLLKDSRLSFLMSPWEGANDDFASVISQFLGDGACVRVVDFSGVPNEIAGTASSAIARILFNFKVWQNADERETNPVLLVCEEAHRYVPNRGAALYSAAQEAIKRLAKEGRKYGIGIFLVSQRPSDVDPTVLSQCNTWVVMRITNENDRTHVKAVLPDSLAGLTNVLSGLRRREAIFVGQAAVIPSRIMISELESTKLPRSHDVNFDTAWQNNPVGTEHIRAVGQRWRYQNRG